MIGDKQSVSLLTLAKEIRSELSAAVQEKYSTRDIHRALALLLVRAGEIVKTETGFEPTEIGLDHGIIEPDGDDNTLRFSPVSQRMVRRLFYKAYPAFAPAVLSPGVLETFRETGKVIPSFDIQGKVVKYENQMWMLDNDPLPRDKTAWAEKQFSTLFFDEIPGVSILNDIGDQFRAEGPKKLAALFYEEAADKADIARRKKILPKLAAVYRQLYTPLRAIKLYEDMSEEALTESATVPFLTAVGFAYCDINNFIAAKEIAEKAVVLGKGRQGAELSALFRKIRSGNGTGR